MTCDIKKKLPFGDCTFDAVYHSHVIEHLTMDEAMTFLLSAVRVIKRNGVMRVVTPDLETIARLYLQKLQDAIDGVEGADDDYQWMILELFDQFARDCSGGKMAQYLKDHPDREFIVSRIGFEAFAYWENKKNHTGFWKRVKNTGFRNIYTGLQRLITTVIIRGMLGDKTQRAYQCGLFRNSGEVHRALFDRYSLTRLLRQAGLSDIRVCSADESRIPNFNSFGLDMIGGRPRKPDSLFMEGVKP